MADGTARLPAAHPVSRWPEMPPSAAGAAGLLSGVELYFIRPGKPADNATIESFNGRFRQECLTGNWFLSLASSRDKVESRRNHYNFERPHRARGNLSPREFAVLSEIRD